MKKSPHVPPRIYIHYSCLLGLSAMLACTVAAKPDTDTEFQQRYSGMYYEAVGTEGAGLRETHHALFEDAKSGQLFDLVWEGELVGELTSGQVVSFNATLDESDDSLLVMDAESLNVEVLAGLRNQRETETQAAGSPTDRLLIVPVRNSNQGVGLPSGCNYSRISNFLISNTAGSMKSHYAEISNQSLRIEGEMYPELTVQSCSYSRMSSEALAVIERDRGRQYVRSFNRKMFILPANCLGYAGLGMVGSLNSASTYSWVSGYYGCYEDVYFHEFGHNIGMSHASTPTQEYGDRSDFMGWGNAVAQINAPHVIQLGWANASRVIQSPQSQNYTLSAMDLGETAASGAKQVIQMSEGRRNNYFVSYRARVQHSNDLNRSFQQKVTVHRQNGYGNTYLLATLSVGGEYEIPGSGNYKIRYVSKQNNEAVIAVDNGGGVTPPSPPTTMDTPKGEFRRLRKTRVTGWAFDPDAGTRPLAVEVEINGTPVATGIANKVTSRARRADARAGRRHKFSISFERLGSGVHSVRVFAKDYLSSTGWQSGARTQIGPTKMISVR